MKKLRFYSVVFTFALLIIPMLQSCLNDDDENRGTRFTIGTIEVIGEKEYFFNLDDGDKMYPSDTTYIHNYTVENNQRVFIHFLPLEEDIPGYDYNVKLIQLENILTKDIIPLTEETADSIGNDRINATSLWITGNYLNIEHQFFHSNNPDKKHMLNLVINETAETPDPEEDTDDREKEREDHYRDADDEDIMLQKELAEEVRSSMLGRKKKTTKKDTDDDIEFIDL